MSTIYINARFLTQRITGVQRFAIEISKQIKKMLPTVIFIAPHNILHKELAAELGAQTIGYNTGAVWEQFDLPLYLANKNKPLLINFCNVAPLFWNNQIITIHDVAYIINPAWFSKKFVAFYKFLIPRIAKNAKLIFTVSNFSKQEINRHLKVDLNKIKVVYNGIVKWDAPTLQGKNIGKYLLVVGSIDKRKNTAKLIDAFDLIDDPTVKLLVVGDANKIFNYNINTSKQNDRIIFLGRVSDNELYKLYKNAVTFIYPSLYEGFGIPALEAMSVGCPVIVSDIPPHREVCNDGALYINPNDAEDIASKINSVLSDGNLREQLIQRGFVNANKFNWTVSSKLILANITGLIEKE